VMHDKGAPLVENVVNDVGFETCQRIPQNGILPSHAKAREKKKKSSKALQQKTRRKRGKRRGRGR